MRNNEACGLKWIPFCIVENNKNKLLREQYTNNPGFVIALDNTMITAHRIGWIIWIYQIIKRTGHHISKAKSVRI